MRKQARVLKYVAYSPSFHRELPVPLGIKKNLIANLD
jgi:hypothetical protein